MSNMPTRVHTYLTCPTCLTCPTFLTCVTCVTCLTCLTSAHPTAHVVPEAKAPATTAPTQPTYKATHTRPVAVGRLQVQNVTCTSLCTGAHGGTTSGTRKTVFHAGIICIDDLVQVQVRLIRVGVGETRKLLGRATGLSGSSLHRVVRAGQGIGAARFLCVSGILTHASLVRGRVGGPSDDGSNGQSSADKQHGLHI